MLRMCLPCVCLLAFTTLGHAQSEDGLVACYQFDEGTGAVVHDQSGQSNDGRLLGGAEWTSDATGSALTMNGTDGYVEIPCSESLDISGGGTIVVWCQPRTLQ